MSISNQAIVSVKSANSEKLVFPGEFKDCKQAESYWTLNIYKKCGIKFYKPLITLKIILFLWFTSVFSTITYFHVFFKQRGITLEEHSIAYTVIPLVQFLTTSCFGLLADKMGRVKPVLLLNLVLTIVASIALIAMPSAVKIQEQIISLKCTKTAGAQNVTINIHCDINNETVFREPCTRTCQNIQKYITNSESGSFDCGLSTERVRGFEMPQNYFSGLQNITIRITNKNSSSEISIEENEISAPCGQFINMSCLVNCTENVDAGNSIAPNNRNLLVVGYIIIQCIFMVNHINIFRCLEITAMILVKEHKSDYGKQRIFCVLGSICGALLSSLVIYISTLYQDNDAYKNCFYPYIILNSVISVLVYNMDLRNLEPGKKFLKKTFVLIKNPDVLFTFLILLLCGTSWGFNRIFNAWYLHDLGVEPFLIGFVETANNIACLLSLYCSEWFVRHSGYSTIFILALVGRSISSFTFSFVKSVWPVFLLSLTEALSYHLFWVGVINYCYEIAPGGLTSTVISVAGSTHFNIGRLLGGFIGGTVMSKYGGKTAYRVMGSMCLSLLTIYIIYVILRKRYHRKS